jgi:Family of unknown function (DUF6081)
MRVPGAMRRLACVVACLATPAAAAASTTTVVYDNFNSPYSRASYNAKWSNPYGLGDMAVAPGDTRAFVGNVFQIDDAPFRTSFDFSVFDHLKYIGISRQVFSVPDGGGSVTFSSQINAKTPGTQPGRVITGTYGPPYSYPGTTPYAAPTFEGQQAGAVMNMVDFRTGQLFDWFVSGTRAFTLIERLPTSVTGSSDPDVVGPGLMYTQIVDEFPIKPGIHTVAIRYTKSAAGIGSVTYSFDGVVKSSVSHVGLPLDSPTRGSLGATVPWTHTYSSATYPGGTVASGEELGNQIQSLAIGHGTFTLLDAFPFQWGWDYDFVNGLASCLFPGPTCDQGSVSIPASHRLFGQGVKATFDNFTVTTTTP